MNDIKRILEDHKKFTAERNWDSFQTPRNLVMALSVEASELVEIFMWLSEKQAASLDEQRLNAASEEIADIFIYLLRVADVLGIDLINATDEKMKKNNKKHALERVKSLA